jgi:serine/threonine-protein kinase
MDRQVAIKVIAGPYAHHPTFAHRFRDEVRACARLQHPHILPVYDVGLEGDRLYLVMAYMPGGTLGQRIAATPDGLPLEEIVCTTAQVAAALDHAHAQNIVHCDLKPGNILLDGRGNAYLGDFGIAQPSAGKEALPEGTFAYMAPEVAGGAKATPASDIYSLGVVIFEMLAGIRPFEVHSREAVLDAHADLVTPDVRQRRSGLSYGVQVVLGQALNTDPAARPLHATSLAQALMRACGSTGLPCGDPASEVQPLLDKGVQTLVLEESPLPDRKTPPPSVGTLGRFPSVPDASPVLAVSTLARAAPQTAVAVPTMMIGTNMIAIRKRHKSSIRQLLLLTWVIGLCLLLAAAAVVVLVLPLLQR